MTLIDTESEAQGIGRETIMILPEKGQSAGPGVSLVAGDSGSLFRQCPTSVNQES